MFLEKNQDRHAFEQSFWEVLELIIWIRIPSGSVIFMILLFISAA